MQTFLAAFGHLVSGVLNGFDRLIFNGHLRQLSYTQGMDYFLWTNQVLLKDFKTYAKERTAILIEGSLTEAQRINRPIIYLDSPNISKEDEARRIAARDQVQDGLICVFKCLQPCRTYDVRGNHEKKLLVLQGKQGKCAHLYHYYMHPEFGFMYARIQTWFPFATQIYINGREYDPHQDLNEWINLELASSGIAGEAPKGSAAPATSGAPLAKASDGGTLDARPTTVQ